ncbi:hypothetical protein T11_11956 [Trichinella zimbabwensis]|uniref:Uncharacterized protein n=1 Tax=Trichinella zimbabwensis TaxID=268475 RepID=A0A0V1GDR4_9BILA|nr:hypothetical protein T11_11956 [Trichinella zimbabwensis]
MSLLRTISEELEFPLADFLWDHFLEVLKSPYQPVVDFNSFVYNFLIFLFK